MQIDDDLFAQLTASYRVLLDQQRVLCDGIANLAKSPYADQFIRESCLEIQHKAAAVYQAAIVKGVPNAIN